MVLRIEFLRTIHSLMLYPKFPWCRIWKPVMPSSLCVPRTLKPREGMWLHQDCGRVSTTTRSPHLPTFALFHENVLSSVSVLYRQEGNEYFVLSLLLLKKKIHVKNIFLRLSNKDFLLRSYLINEREENGLQQSPCQSKERERESFLCHRPQPSRSSHSRDYVFLLIVRDPVWNWMRICYKSVELYCSERPYLSSWREKEKGK